MSENTRSWVPEIVYEEGQDGLSSHIPFIHVPEEEVMPPVLFLFESRETGEFEPGLEGEEVPVVQLDLHQYANMVQLKEKLDLVTYDKVRNALGLEPLAVATAKGKAISSSVRNSIGD